MSYRHRCSSIVLYGLLAALVGCTFDRSGIPLNAVGGDGGEGPDATADNAPDEWDAGGDGMDEGDPQQPAALVDEGLIVRYFIDEAVSGQMPTELEDSAPEPLPLEIHYDSELSFTEDEDGNRGLTWRTASSSQARASVQIGGNKIFESLHGKTTGSIEVVVDVQMLNSGGSRISHIGKGDESGYFTLRAPRDDVSGILMFSINGTGRGYWSSTPNTAKRLVLHAVFSSETLIEADRAIIYVNGKRAPLIAAGITEGMTLNLRTDAFYVLGNRESGSRNFQGTIFYAALYSSALTRGQVENNATLLMRSDDRPQSSEPMPASEAVR